MKRFDITYLSESKQRVEAHSIEAAALHAHNLAFRDGRKVLSVIEVPALEPPADVLPPPPAA